MKSVRKLWWTACIVIGICLVAYGGYVLARIRAYARVEELTRAHAHKVKPFVDQFASRYDLNVVYIKVFEYQATSAKVFVVENEIALEDADASGSFFHLTRIDVSSDWELASPQKLLGHLQAALMVVPGHRIA